MFQCIKLCVSMQESTSEEDTNFKVKATKQIVMKKHMKPPKVWNQPHFVNYHSFRDYKLHMYQCNKLWISMYTILCIRWYTSIFM